MVSKMPCQQSNFIKPGSALDLKFNDVRVIGSSSSGCVLSAVEKEGKQERYALKRLSLKRKSHCRVALRELKILKRLRHENIVKVSSVRTPTGCDIREVDTDTFRKLDYVYLAQELLDTDLQSILSRNGKIEEKVAKLFLYQLLRGLKYIHTANAIHRDIKPGNLFINTHDLTLKVGDFGLARVVDPKYEHAGHLTELVTTRYYRSPEVIKCPGDYDSSVDIWSCGCVFAEMCTGNVLFPGQHDLQQIDCIQSWFHDGGRFMANKLTGMSQAGLDILQKMLRLDPSKRLTATQLLEDPYFGDIHDSSDEPVCPGHEVFHIENEVDDLPRHTLQELFLNECCPDKFRTEDLNSTLFDGFDDVFSPDVERQTCEKDVSCFVDSGFSYSATSEENSCPSLLNLLTSGISDEPCRDPACTEAKSHATFILGGESFEKDDPISDHCSPNFPKVSSFLDMNKATVPPHVDSSRASEAFITTRSFQRIPRSFLCSVGLDKELITKLNRHAVSNKENCRLSELAASQDLKSGKLNRQFNHWDTIRIWI